MGRICDLLMEDKKNNSSNYALVVASEGAVWKEGEVKEYGEADAYGHRKKADIGQILGEEIRKRTGNETINSDLTYDLRAGEPDAIDQIAAIGFANIALELIRDGVSGRMTAIQGGRYAQVPIPDAALGPRKVDIASTVQHRALPPQLHIKARRPAPLQRLLEFLARGGYIGRWQRTSTPSLAVPTHLDNRKSRLFGYRLNQTLILLKSKDEIVSVAVMYVRGCTACCLFLGGRFAHCQHSRSYCYKFILR